MFQFAHQINTSLLIFLESLRLMHLMLVMKNRQDKNATKSGIITASEKVVSVTRLCATGSKGDES
jgi:hypothetical protein